MKEEKKKKKRKKNKSSDKSYTEAHTSEGTIWISDDGDVSFFPPYSENV